MSTTRTFDALVVGAGSAGAAAAAHLAGRGLRTALVDARPFAEAGARWVNYVPRWMFEAADLEPPVAPERRGRPAPMTVTVGGARVTVPENPCLAVDMRALVARLQSRARTAGAEAFEQVHVHRVGLVGGRPVELETDAGVLRAALFVDASGLNGVLRRRVPRLAADCPTVDRAHLCSAAQEVRRVRDPAAARAWQAHHRLVPDEILSHPGVAGGYSVINLSVDAAVEEVDILTGCIVGDGFTGSALVARAVREHPWIGERVFGGAGTIPLRRPYDRLTSAGVALIGNAACQVFPAHGSGVGIGLIAARELADAVATGQGDPGDERHLWAWQAAFHRRHGAVLAAYDLFRRLTQSLDAADFGRLLRAGLVNANQMSLGLLQALPRIGPDELLGFLSAARLHPALAGRAAASLAGMPALIALYRAHPERPGARALGLWSRAVARICRDRPDVTTWGP